MFRFIILVLLAIAIGSVEAISGPELKNLTEAVASLEKLDGIPMNEWSTILEEVKKQLRDLIGDGEEETSEFSRVSIASSNMSSVTHRNDPRYTADKATDGDSKTWALTELETNPWYSAELGVRFKAIRVKAKISVDSYRLYRPSYYSFYTVDNGVEKECDRRDTRPGWFTGTDIFDWTVECSYAGTGFKIKTNGGSGHFANKNIILKLQQVEVDIQL